MPKINNCTSTNPMPKGRDQMGQHWYHHGSAPRAGEPEMQKEGDTQIWVCPNCQLEFKVTRGKKRPIKEVVDKLNSLKKQGLHFP